VARAVPEGSREGKPGPHVDVVHVLALVEDLEFLAVQSVHAETALLVVPQDEAFRRIPRMDPDRGIVGGVAGVADRRRLDGRKHGDDGILVPRLRGEEQQQAGHRARDLHPSLYDSPGEPLSRRGTGRRGRFNEVDVLKPPVL